MMLLRRNPILPDPRSQSKHLMMFRKECPDKMLYDLSANVCKRKRTETKANLLPCLTTSATLWHLAILYCFRCS